MPFLYLPHGFLRRGPVFVFFIIKIFRHSTSYFFKVRWVWEDFLNCFKVRLWPGNAPVSRGKMRMGLGFVRLRLPTALQKRRCLRRMNFLRCGFGVFCGWRHIWGMFCLYGQVYLDLGANLMGRFLAQLLFGNYALIQFLTTIKTFLERYDLPSQGVFWFRQNSAAYSARELFKPSKDSGSLVA